ncbi:MAG: DUF4162 domain-containing protein, partial [Desulfurococcaceae archaeon]
QVDVLSKHALWSVIRELKKEGTTVIIATNDMFEAERVCERVAIVYKGKLRALGTVGELKDSIPSGDVIEVHYDGILPTSVVSSLVNYGKVEVGEGSLKIFVEKAEEKVIDVLDLLRRSSIRVLKVMVKEPTLDDVFTYITGARLREEV